MTKEELNYIKDVFSQIIDDIAGNPDWYEAARAVASDLGTLERELEKKVVSLPSNLDEAAEEYKNNHPTRAYWLEGEFIEETTPLEIAFKDGAKWREAQIPVPDDMRDAADEYSVTPDNKRPVDDEKYKSFIAGAVWMAEQGIIADFEVNKLAARAWLTAVDKDIFQKDIYDNFEAGDKVIVQIRKKK